MPYIEIDPIINPQPQQILAEIDNMFAGRQLAVHVRSDEPLYVVERAKKISVSFPWLNSLGGWEELGGTELAGTGSEGINDVQAHKDYRSPLAMNLHATATGRTRAGFVLVGEDKFNDDDTLGYPLSYFAGHNHDVHVAEIKAGDVICFRGGVVAHRFVSATPERLSYVQAYMRQKPLHSDQT